MENANKIFNYLSANGYNSNGLDAHLVLVNPSKVYYEDQGGKLTFFITKNSIFFECISNDEEPDRQVFSNFEEFKDYFESYYNIN